MALIQLVAAVGVSFALSQLVQRAKQCLDFACTVHFFHLLFVIVYNRAFPTQFTWWILQIISTTVCTVLGEFLCMRLESQEIKLEGGPSRYDL
uniref:Protein SYS1 homolog n=1 Tax=Caenorhabditis japonica TaxID=281687 RepID=A0A8R1DHK5_CAEJA